MRRISPDSFKTLKGKVTTTLVTEFAPKSDSLFGFWQTANSMPVILSKTERHLQGPPLRTSHRTKNILVKKVANTAETITSREKLKAAAVIAVEINDTFKLK